MGNFATKTSGFSGIVDPGTGPEDITVVKCPQRLHIGSPTGSLLFAHDAIYMPNLPTGGPYNDLIYNTTLGRLYEDGSRAEWKRGLEVLTDLVGFTDLMNGYSYQFVEGEDISGDEILSTPMVGILVDEIEAVCDEKGIDKRRILVFNDTTEKFVNMNAKTLGTLCLVDLKDARTRLATAEGEIEVMKSEIAELKDRLSALEAP